MSKQKSLIHRVNLVLSSLGKPLFWALIFPIVLGIILVRIIKKLGSRVGRLGLWLYFYTIVGLILGLFIYGGYWFYHNVLEDLPSPSSMLTYTPALTTKIYDRNHTLLYKMFKDQNRSLVRLSDLPKSLVDATISIEDKDFYQHKGFSFAGFGRAIRSFFEGNKLQGGSTITQQLVKNTLLSPERTLKRKLKELILAIQVEQTMSKDQILEMYLNQVSYGGSVYGVEEASERFFGKHAHDLDLAQSAFLAGLPAAPSAYSPMGPTPELADMRQQEVLRRMVEDKKISPLQAQMAQSEDLTFKTKPDDMLAPHFVMYVRDLLERQYGEDVLSQGGFEVTTTLDLPTQTSTEKIVHDEVEGLKNLRVSNGAALVTNPNTGEILAMVGSRDYFDTTHDGQVNVTIRPRQPGSSIKPLMYSAALEHGFTPATILDDSPITYSSPGSPPYSPRNYDGTFHGKEALRFALANSHNVPAVKTESSIGLQTFIDQARALGISTWDDTTRFGLSLTLGSGEVLMTDMATAYGTFANGGIRVNLNPIIEVRSPNGEVLYTNPCVGSTTPCHGQEVLDQRIAYQLTNILSDNLARSRAFGLHSVLTIPGQEVAVKTGTTNSLRDNWTIGYSTNRLVATWVGNNDNSPMSRVTSGITGASPIWNKIMRTQLDDAHPNVFPVPSGLVSEQLCLANSQAACGNQCGATYMEYFLSEEPQPACVASTTAAIATPLPTIDPSHILTGINTTQ